VEANSLIIREGDPSDCMYLIVAGSVSVFRNASEGRIELAQLHEGDFFGELSLVDEGPRSASVEAGESTVLLVVGRDSARALAGVRPAAAIHLLTAVGRSLVERIRSGNQKFLDLILSGYVSATPSGSIPDSKQS